MRAAPACRLCAEPLRYVMADLGATPLANSYLRPSQLDEMEPYYPLRAFVCEHCFLVQLESFASPETIFSQYAYFSSYSDSLLTHSKMYADGMARRLGLKSGDRVVEIASNDGYLLQYFVEKGLDVLGVEPAANVAAAAVGKGIPTVVRFFGAEVARDLVAAGHGARLLIANNVMAHVPALNDFIEGLAILLEPGGRLTIEFHHLLSLIRDRQFDTIYHEHCQYFSLAAAAAALARHGLTVIDVEAFPTQGGSLRVHACHRQDLTGSPGRSVAETLAREDAEGLRNVATYRAFSDQIRRIKLALLSFLVTACQSGKSVVCYGAAAKGNTLLNYCGVRADLVDYAVDRSPHKQGHFLPGSRIPIDHPDRVRQTKPDYLLILPWNVREEIIDQMSCIRDWGGRFVIAIPELRVLE